MRLLPHARPNLYGRRRAARSLLPHPAARSHEDASTPNACNDCHKDKTADWAALAIEKRHGAVRKGFQDWGEAFHLARGGDPAARDLLLKLVDEPVTPAVARATALIEAQRLPSISVEQAASRSLEDPDPLVRASPPCARNRRPRRSINVGGAPVRCCPIRYGRCASRPPACSPTSPRRRSRTKIASAWRPHGRI